MDRIKSRWHVLFEMNETQNSLIVMHVLWFHETEKITNRPTENSDTSHYITHLISMDYALNWLGSVAF